MKPLNKVISSLDEIYCVYPTGWLFAVYVRATDLIASLGSEGLRPATLLKKNLWHRCFPVNFAKFLRTPFFTEHIWAIASGTRNPASLIESSRMAQLSKLRKDANPIKMHVLPRNSRS